MLGMWPSWGPFFPVHQNSNRRVLPNYFDPAAILFVNQRTVYYDSAAFQSTALSYRHGMLAPDQSQAEGRAAIDRFIRAQMFAAQIAAAQGDQQASLDLFTAALHTLQDLTSPSHVNQITGELYAWLGTAGTTNKLRAVAHVAGEAFDPGPGSALDAATNFTARWLTGAINPQGNVIDALFNEVYGPTITLDPFVVTAPRWRAGDESSNGGTSNDASSSKESTAARGNGGGIWIINIVTQGFTPIPSPPTADQIFNGDFRGGAPGSIRRRVENLIAKSWEEQVIEDFRQWTGEGRRLQ